MKIMEIYSESKNYYSYGHRNKHTNSMENRSQFVIVYLNGKIKSEEKSLSNNWRR